MLIFPEGGRTPDGWGQAFRGGAAYLSLRCGVPVVPVHVEGTGRVLRKGKNVPRPARTTVTFGTPLHAAEGEDARRLRRPHRAAVAELADEATTDWWQARRRAAAGADAVAPGPRRPAPGAAPGPSATARPAARRRPKRSLARAVARLTDDPPLARGSGPPIGGSPASDSRAAARSEVLDHRSVAPCLVGPALA